MVVIKTSIAQIIARALNDAGITIVTNVPGFGGTQVFDAFCEAHPASVLPSFHEEVAFSIAHGASLAGKRSATLLKAHGFAKAANSVVDSLSVGTTAGFLVFVFDDAEGAHSDSILNSATLVSGTGIPYRRLKGQKPSQEICDALAQSEELQLPVVILVDSRDIQREGRYEPTETCTAPQSYCRDVVRHVLCPFLSCYHDEVLRAKISGHDWRGIEKPLLPNVPESLPDVWRRQAEVYKPFFEVFRTIRGDIVTGDTGISSLFAFPPYDCIDVCSYMGGSLPLAIGAYLAGYKDAWALTGDFSFIAAGHLGLLEAMQRDIPLRTVIFSNKKAEATGGQAIPGGMLEHILKGYEGAVVFIRNPWDEEELEAVLRQAKEAGDMRIVVVEYELAGGLKPRGD
ncbi:MAG: hypothetical protein JXD19_08620 [Deltaproteobacteria bacterium]|nr:hypothetical protein [Deltaproteobacteria bacterium]